MAVNITLQSSTALTLFTLSLISDEGPNYRAVDDDAIRSIVEGLMWCDWIQDVHTEPISATITRDTVEVVAYPDPEE